MHYQHVAPAPIYSEVDFICRSCFALIYCYYRLFALIIIVIALLYVVVAGTHGPGTHRLYMVWYCVSTAIND